MTTETRQMGEKHTGPVATPAVVTETNPPSRLAGLRGIPPLLGATLAALAAAYALPLVDLVQFALQGELYSYIILVPVVSGYLFATAPRSPLPAGSPHRLLAGVFAMLGLVAMVSRLALGSALQRQDALALGTVSFVAFVTAAAAFFLDRAAFRRARFPLAFLVFMAPFPIAMEQAIEVALQHGSAPAAHAMFLLAGTTMHYHDLIFELPGIALRVAPECSGIRSTLVLFMVSLVAGHLFLRTPWKRAVITLAVIPLALIRNGFRIFVIGQLCIHLGPHMIDSMWHHQGGPIFFALSLVPFSILVFYLVRSERGALRASTPAVK
ncbi:MAG: archaeosortase/exosortase family protein [Opitutaceae bacterium]|nr:archaeosortase/exosortase family protein [Opitutaceae bacterium]